MTALAEQLRLASTGDDDALTHLGLCLQATRSNGGLLAAQATAQTLGLDFVRALGADERADVLAVVHAQLGPGGQVVRALWALRQDASDEALEPVVALLQAALDDDPGGIVAEQALEALLGASPSTARAAAVVARRVGEGEVASTAVGWLDIHGDGQT